ncbi:MAG: condensation domain-containing protein, partial [Blastocatellia bacterium]
LVADAVVAASTGNGNRRLTAFVVPRNPKGVTPELLRHYLRERLPAYMVPSSFQLMSELPLLPNGKVNRSALSEERTGSVYESPVTETEEVLVRIWEDALGKAPLGVLDDFYEAGGNSLSATRIASQIYRQLGKKIEIKTLLTNPTIRTLARGIARLEGTAYKAIAAAPSSEAYELSPAQRRFWLQDRLASQREKTAEPMAFWLRGPLDLNALDLAFKTVIERHEILRTVFYLDEKQPKQRVVEPEAIGFAVERLEIDSGEDAVEAVRSVMVAEAGAPMDVSEDRLFRVKLMKVGPEIHACICSLHHIITDGWSNVILLNEIILSYQALVNGDGNPLSALRIQYKDYARWINDLLGGVDGQDLRRFWLGHLGGLDRDRQEFPADFDRDPATPFKRRTHRFTIDDERATPLETVCAENGATLFMGLMACIKTLIYRCTGDEQVVVGTPIAGRVHPDIENQVGPYLNVLPLVDFVNGDQTFVDLLKLVRETTQNAYAHQLYPIDFIISDLGVRRDAARNSLFDIGFTLQNQNALAIKAEAAGLTISQIGDLHVESESPEALTDFWFIAERTESGIGMLIVYNGSLFQAQTAERVASDLAHIVRTFSANPESAIGDIRLSSSPAPAIERVTIDIAFSKACE